MQYTKNTVLGPMRLFPLLACLLFLPDAVTCLNDFFQVNIVGYELDCAEQYCRHTGQIFGNFRHPFKTLPQASLISFCVDLEVLYCYDRDAIVCTHEENWARHCTLWSFCQAEETCHGKGRNLYCTCKAGDPYNFTISPLFDHSLFRLVFKNAWNKFSSLNPSEMITTSGTFEYRNRRDSIHVQTGVVLVLWLTAFCSSQVLITFYASFQE